MLSMHCVTPQEHVETAIDDINQTGIHVPKNDRNVACGRNASAAFLRHGSSGRSQIKYFDFRTQDRIHVVI